MADERSLQLVQYAVPIVWVKDSREQSRIIEPFLDGVPQQIFDLRTDVERGPRIVERIDIRHDRQLLDKSPVSLLRCSKLRFRLEPLELGARPRCKKAQD